MIIAKSVTEKGWVSLSHSDDKYCVSFDINGSMVGSITFCWVYSAEECYREYVQELNKYDLISNTY